MRFSSYRTFIRTTFISTLAVFFCAQMAACASDSHASKGAARLVGGHNRNCGRALLSFMVKLQYLSGSSECS
jgi:hypothetical protein